jgi:hypothetical protein
VTDAFIPTDAAKRALFAALVGLQDEGHTVVGSRAEVGRRFRATPDQVRAIEREGLDKKWPPLGPGDSR